jgi:hypothetical protein
VYKQKQLLEKERQKEEAVKMMEDYNKRVLEQENKRNQEIAAREAKIQSFMNKMKDDVVRKNND